MKQSNKIKLDKKNCKGQVTIYIILAVIIIAIIAAISCIVFDACRVLRDRNKMKSPRIKGLRIMGGGKPYRDS